MAKMILAIGDAKKGSGKTYKIELEGDATNQLIGKKIGDKVSLVETKDADLVITGGTDNAGFPMRKDVEGPNRKKIFTAGGVGYKPKRKGCKDRKTVAGNTVSAATAQVNLKLVKEGKETLEKIFAPAPAEEEAPKEE